MFLASGTRLGPYQILDFVGAGGMGEVYRARDTRLDRTVAVKVLPTRFLNDTEQRARFEREARAISLLSHPNICTLHDIGEEAGTPFLVMEHLTGDTLAVHLQKGPLPLARALRIATQVAEGLAAAHKQGIVHRDLKPGNLMVTPNGVKILDFGLAKLQEADLVAPPPSVATTIDVLTGEGVIVGSRPYMAPEQLQGQPTDARTDIWALGAIIYEMLAGKRAFAADSAVGLAVAILEREPAPLLSIRPETPPALDRIVSRCLAKDPDARWFSAHDVAAELAWVAESSGAAPRVEGGHPASATRRRRWWRWVGAGSGLAGAALVGAISARACSAVPSPSSSVTPHQAGDRTSGPGLLLARPRQVTFSAGWEDSPAISPDGNLVAYVSNESGAADIWIVGVGGTNALRLTADDAIEDKPCWFPDGRAVAFASTRDGHSSIWQVPVLGGGATLLVPEAKDPAIDPSGTRIAFVTAATERIAVADLADPQRMVVLTHDDDGLWNHRDPAWSPDGRTIAYAAQRGLWTVPAAGGEAKRLTTDDQADEEPAWSSDGSYVFFRSIREGTEAIWRVPASGGSPLRVTLGNGPESHPSLSRSGRDIVFTTATRHTNVILHDLVTGAETAFQNARSEYMPTFSRDGRRLLFVSDRGDRFRIWQQSIADGRPAGAAVVLADDRGAYPAYSPDGRWVAYYGVGQGQPRTVKIVPSTGGAAVRLVDSPDQQLYPAWSPRGTDIAFVSEGNHSARILVLPVREGKPAGPPRTLASGPYTYEAPVWSPDGLSIAYIAIAQDGSRAVWVLRADGTTPGRNLTGAGPYMRTRWHPREPVLLVSAQRGHGFEIVEVSTTGGAPTPMKRPLHMDRNAGLVDFDISADGRWLTFCREAPAGGDVWIAEVTNP